MNDEVKEIKYLGQDDIRDYIMKKDYQIYQLQQRIDKAIEYIEEHNMPYTSYLGKERQVNKLELKDEEYDKLLSILRGKDDNNN